MGFNSGFRGLIHHLVLQCCRFSFLRWHSKPSKWSLANVHWLLQDDTWIYIQHWCNDNFHGRPKCLERRQSQYHFVNHKSHMNCLGINSCFEEERLANIRLSSCWACGIAQCYMRLCVPSDPLSSFLSLPQWTYDKVHPWLSLLSDSYSVQWNKNWVEDVERWRMT